MARVLIVEPEADLRLLAEEAVHELGHEALAVEHCPEHVDADVLMLAPFAGMAALVGRLRVRGRLLPVICAGTRPGGAEAEALAPVAYLVKPYRLQELERALEKALGGAQSA